MVNEAFSKEATAAYRRLATIPPHSIGINVAVRLKTRTVMCLCRHAPRRKSGTLKNADASRNQSTATGWRSVTFLSSGRGATAAACQRTPCAQRSFGAPLGSNGIQKPAIAHRSSKTARYSRRLTSILMCHPTAQERRHAIWIKTLTSRLALAMTWSDLKKIGTKQGWWCCWLQASISLY